MRSRSFLKSSYPFIVLIFCFLLFFSDIFLGSRSVPHDSANFFYPIERFIASEYHKGRLPLWNPYILAGYPSFADPQVGTFSPLVMALLSIPENASKRWFDTVEVLHIYMGGIFIFLLCRRLGASVNASLIASITFMFGGSALARLQHVAHIYGYGYLSAAFYFLERLLSKPRWKFALGLGLFCGLMLTVPTHITYLSALLMSAFILLAFIADLKNRPVVILKKSGLLVFAGFLALTICAPQLYALFLFLPISNRPLFLFISNELSYSVFMYVFEIVNHAHTIFGSIALIQVPQPGARKTVAIETEPRFALCYVFTIFNFTGNAVFRFQTVLAPAAGATVLISDIGPAEATVHAAGRDQRRGNHMRFCRSFPRHVSPLLKA